MKGSLNENSVMLFDVAASMLNTYAENYGWWCSDREEAFAVCDWCEGILKAYAVRKESINMVHYLRARRSIAFFKMVAAKRTGEDKLAEELYAAFIEAVRSEDLTDEEKDKVIQLLNNDIAHYSKY